MQTQVGVSRVWSAEQSLGLPKLTDFNTAGELPGASSRLSGDLLAVNQGTFYPLLLKLEHEGSIASPVGRLENNRCALRKRAIREAPPVVAGPGNAGLIEPDQNLGRPSAETGPDSAVGSGHPTK